MKNGIIAVDKPAGISSAAVVARVKKLLGVRKVGHTGTLDPFATGLMLCGINKGTKLSRFLLASSKSYIADVELGRETDTLDVTGNIVKQFSYRDIDDISHEKIISVIDLFKGVQMQHPPVYSALKHNGKPLYQLAREGHPVQKPPRKIEIHSINIESINKPCITISVQCSSGTYIRSLAHDMGRELGCGALLSSLRRTETCGFSIDNAVSLAQLEAMSREDALNYVIPMADVLSFMPVIHADTELMTQIKFGRPFIPNNGHVKSPDTTNHENPGSCKNRDFHIKTDNSSQAAGDHQSLSTQVFLSATTLRISSDNDCKDVMIPGGNRYFRVIDFHGKLAAIVEYDEKFDVYNYCCVFAN